MSWNHRVVKIDNSVTVREVYYDEAGSPIGYTGSAIVPEDPHLTPARLRKCLSQDTIDWTDDVNPIEIRERYTSVELFGR